MQGNINLIEAAAKKGVKKFILLTSIGVGDSKDAPPEQVYNVLKPVLVEKGKAEDKLKVSTCRAHFFILLFIHSFTHSPFLLRAYTLIHSSTHPSRSTMC